MYDLSRSVLTPFLLHVNYSNLSMLLGLEISFLSSLWNGLLSLGLKLLKIIIRLRKMLCLKNLLHSSQGPKSSDHHGNILLKLLSCTQKYIYLSAVALI